MYARSTTFHADPARLDAGIEFCQDHVLPALMHQSGCIGLSLLVDRQDGRCIATSAWQTRATMRDSEAAVSGLRAEADTVLAAEHAIVEWEVTAVHRHHRSTDDSRARVTWAACDPEGLERATDALRYGGVPQLDQVPDFGGTSLMVDRNAGRLCLTATYGTTRALRDSAEGEVQVRDLVLEEAGAEVLEIAEFELVLAHFHVPELV